MINLDLSGKTAWITGASRGIGAATAQLFARAGADLVLNSRSMDVTAVIDEYRAAYERVPLAAQADVSDTAAMRQIYAAACERFGGVDILINNAALNSTVALLDADEAEWLRVMEVDLFAIARLCALVAPGMMGRGGGRIVNIASNLGAFALRGKGVYSAAKAGLMQLTRSMALEWGADGILVNALAVGAVDTEQEGSRSRDIEAVARSIILGRLGRPEEIAGAALFLASDLATFITGQSIFVDGGASVWFAS